MRISVYQNAVPYNPDKHNTNLHRCKSHKYDTINLHFGLVWCHNKSHIIACSLIDIPTCQWNLLLPFSTHNNMYQNTLTLITKCPIWILLKSQAIPANVFHNFPQPLWQMLYITSDPWKKAWSELQLEYMPEKHPPTCHLKHRYHTAYLRPVSQYTTQHHIP
jgi:hypothetical protein